MKRPYRTSLSITRASRERSRPILAFPKTVYISCWELLTSFLPTATPKGAPPELCFPSITVLHYLVPQASQHLLNLAPIGLTKHTLAPAVQSFLDTPMSGRLSEKRTPHRTASCPCRLDPSRHSISAISKRHSLLLHQWPSLSKNSSAQLSGQVHALPTLPSGQCHGQRSLI
jgi:hypothetical protein